MTQLVSFYDTEPVKNADNAGVQQHPIGQSNDFEFPTGAVVARVVYVAHPKAPKTLLPFASYDELVLRDKFNEAVRIANELGACSVEVRSYRGEQRSLDGHARIVGIGPAIRTRRARSSETTYVQNGVGGPPNDPSPLRWPDEPGFQAACLARLKNGATHIEIVVENQTDVETAAKLAGRLKKIGFDLGASARSDRWHTFRLLAEFPGPNGARPATKEQPPETARPRLRRRGGHSQ